MERYPSCKGLSALCLSVIAFSFASSASAVVISEVLYDASGGDTGNVFIELYGSPGTALSGWSLQGVNGGDGNVYRTVMLSGVIPDDGVFVVADDAGGATTNIANADLVLAVDLQNSPDSVQLYNGDVLVDALGYGDFTGLFFAGEGDAAPDVSAGSSLARIDALLDTNNNLADFMVLASPTPGMVPMSAVPLPASLYLFGSGLSLLSALRKRRLGG